MLHVDLLYMRGLLVYGRTKGNAVDIHPIPGQAEAPLLPPVIFFSPGACNSQNETFWYVYGKVWTGIYSERAAFLLLLIRGGARVQIFFVLASVFPFWGCLDIRCF